MGKTDYFNDVVKNEFPNLIQILERNMNLGYWGVRLKASGVFRHFPPSLIYNSKFCRIRFIWDVPDPRDKFVKSITVKYGRSHTPDDERVMIWKNESCYCWHSIDLAVNFLEGNSPADIGVLATPKIMKKYLQPNAQKELGLEELDYAERPIELVTKMHSGIWEIYGEQIFELLDLHRPKLWEEYVSYVKEYYLIWGGIPGMSPPISNIC